MGGGEERARGVVQQSPEVLRSADIEGRFGELTAISWAGMRSERGEYCSRAHTYAGER
jgi:hypothetical protein